MERLSWRKTKCALAWMLGQNLSLVVKWRNRVLLLSMYKIAYRYRIYPTIKQEGVLLRMIEAARKLWNDALAHRMWKWEEFRRSTTYNEQARILTGVRKTDPEIGMLYSQVGQDVLRRLDKAFRAFFNHSSGYPKFKKKRGCGSITFPQAYRGCVKIDDGKIMISGVGWVPLVLHRKLPSDGTMKTCTVIQEPCGEWYVSLTLELSPPVPRLLTEIKSPVGLDLGLRSLVTTTDGAKITPPGYLRKSEKRLRRLQRKLSRHLKGSKNWERSRRLLATQHAKVACQREDFNQKLSASLVRNHDLIAFEDLRINNMIQNHALAKSIQDAGWRQIVDLSKHKAERAGKILVEVSARYSTQECYFCGAINDVGLDLGEFTCVRCGRRLDRDFNASSVVLKRGIAKVGLDRPELTPVEIRPPLGITIPTSRVKEAGTTCGEVHAQ